MTDLQDFNTAKFWAKNDTWDLAAGLIPSMYSKLRMTSNMWCFYEQLVACRFFPKTAARPRGLR